MAATGCAATALLAGRAAATVGLATVLATGFGAGRLIKRESGAAIAFLIGFSAMTGVFLSSMTGFGAGRVGLATGFAIGLLTGRAIGLATGRVTGLVTGFEVAVGFGAVFGRMIWRTGRRGAKSIITPR